MRKILYLLATVLLWTHPLAAETIQVKPDLAVELHLPGESWVLSQKAPAFLVEKIAEHLEHELAAQGKHPGSAKLKEVAGKRLAANEAFVYNPDSGAILSIDFSPLREGENPPSKRAVATSARYAGEGLEEEEGVTEVTHEVGKAWVSGAKYAYRIDARYLQHGEPTKFIGIVGFVSPYWVFLYYNDPLKEPHDYEEMDDMLQSLVLTTGAGN